MSAAICVLFLLSQSCPPLADRDRFPDREMARQNLEVVREYCCHVRAAASCGPSWHAELWRARLARAEHCFQCWDWLHAAQGGEGRDEAYWRHSLHRLRKLLGNEDYYAGRMPWLP